MGESRDQLNVKKGTFAKGKLAEGISILITSGEILEGTFKENELNGQGKKIYFTKNSENMKKLADYILPQLQTK